MIIYWIVLVEHDWKKFVSNLHVHLPALANVLTLRPQLLLAVVYSARRIHLVIGDDVFVAVVPKR